MPVLFGIAGLLFVWSYVLTRRAKAKGIRPKNSRMFGREFRPDAPIGLALMIVLMVGDLLAIGTAALLQEWLLAASGATVLLGLLLTTIYILRPPRDPRDTGCEPDR